MRLYSGIDLHSTNNYVAILDEQLQTVGQRKLPNDLQQILAYLEPHREELAGVAVESTFNWYWLVDGLMEAGYRVHLVNPAAAKKYDGLKYSDDRHDARWSAHLLALGILPQGYIYPKDDRPFRDLLRRRAFLVKKRTSLLLAERNIVERSTGQRVGSNDLKRWTVRSVQALVEDPRVALSIVSMLRVIDTINRQVKEIEQVVLSGAKLREEFGLLRTARGIGEAIALTIMYEVGDIRRFDRVGNFASYCRCVKSERLSNGKKKGVGHKRNGNPYLSWAFTEAAHFAVRFEPLAKRFFDRKRAATNAIVAHRALANKLARACFYVIRDQAPFDPKRAFC
jgi:transposase